MRVLSLFSGIGAFDLGLHEAGMRTVAFCEADAFCARILAKHWPGVPCYNDVRTLTAARLNPPTVNPARTERLRALLAEGLKQVEIARREGVAANTMSEVLKRHGLRQARRQSPR